MSDFLKRFAWAVFIISTMETCSVFIVWAWQFRPSGPSQGLASEAVHWLATIMLFLTIISGNIGRDKELQNLHKRLLKLERGEKGD